MNIEVQDLITCKDYCLLLYPNSEKGRGGRSAAARWREKSAEEWWSEVGVTAGAGGEAAAYWSKTLGCAVQFLNPGDTMFVVAVKGDYLKIIAPGNKWGWIINQSWLNLVNLDKTVEEVNV